MKVVEIIRKRWTNIDMSEVSADYTVTSLDIFVRGYKFDNGLYDIHLSVKEDGWIKESANISTKRKSTINKRLAIYGLAI